MLSRFELRRFRGTLPVLALIFAMLVPVLYGAIYLYANWDPYGSLSHLPVAVVNADRPATVDGQEVTAGADVEKELLDAHTFDWRATTQADADAGLVEGRYYLVMTIPEDFSANLVSAQTTDPKRAQITLRRNDANGFVIGSVTSSAQGSIERAVDKAAVDAYFKAVFKNLGKIRDGMQSAADGAAQLADGSTAARQGAQRLTAGITTAKDGSAQLVTGLGQADAGAGQLAAGASQLNDNMPALQAGADQLTAGLGQLSTGSSSLASGAHQVADGTQRLNDTVIPVLDKVISVQQTVATDVARVDAAVQKLNGAVNGQSGTVSSGLADVGTQLDALAAADPAVASTTQYAAARAALARVADRATSIESTSGQIASDSANANAKVQSFVAENKAADAKAKLTALNEGAHQVASGADQLHAGIGQAGAGASRLSTGVGTVATAVGQVSEGASALKTGLDTLTAGATQLDAGLAKLVDGGGQLDAGLGKLADGATQLHAGLTDGLKQIPVLTQDQQDKAALVLSSPADVTMDVLNPAHVYGRGLAPLFFSIALWVFGISGFLVMRPITGRLLAGRQYPLRVAVAAWVPIGAVATAGAVAMLAVVWGGIGLAPVHPWVTLGLVVLTALVFSGIAHLLRMALGLPGSALLLIWLILQLSATGGTYPVELLPPFFQAIHPFMPITYTIDAFRMAISGGEWSRLTHDVVVLIGIGIAALVLDVLVVMRRQRFRMADLHPPLG